MNEIRVQSYIMRHRELVMKVGERGMNASCKNEFIVADDEDIK